MERAAADAALSAMRGENAQWHDGTFTSWAKNRSATHPYPAGAGETIDVADTDLAPWDDFTTRLDASPVPPSHPAGLASPGSGDAAGDEEHDADTDG